MINLSISHRTIKIGAIFIAVLILAVMAIPTRSLEAGVLEPSIPRFTLENKGIYEKLPAVPFQAFVEDTTVTMYIPSVMQLGLYEFGGKRHGWAHVRVFNEVIGQPHNQRLLYIPGVRLQSLFETAYSTGGDMVIHAHPIAKPEGWDRRSEETLYKVTSATLLELESGFGYNRLLLER